ncbi:SH3 domain-containing protein [Chitinophaga horti]|uniref:SH3 domain-containing protein n=1 Tax=Chitinophaga horti TaxID=2920382 RepID=A0ABY6J047_9BACT|nr:SH3 domain-containing protein [Chitinophaga horti]UYQ91694.1 SH3 domain-containing protein [Chitinophaga horti]
MWHRFILSALLLISSIGAFAQDEDPGLWVYNSTQPGETVTVLADTAYLRDQPATTGKIVRTLTAGARLTFLEDAAAQQIRGFKTKWARVRINENGSATEAYIWKGLLAIGAYSREGKRFLFGIDRCIPDKDKDMPGTYFAKAMVIDSVTNVVAARRWQLLSNESLSFCEGKVLGPMGLDSLQQIFRICFSGEACGIPTNYYYFGWTGTGLLALPGKAEVGDADVYYYTERLFFPSEKGGQPGKIVKTIEEEEVLEETDKNGNSKSKITHSREVFRWDGKVAVKE